ncbi:MAG: antitoxin MazE family protein [Pseudomonadota bacterium]
MGSVHVNTRVQRHRAALRQAGLCTVQIWVADTRRPDFEQKCRRQARLVAQADGVDADVQRLTDEAVADMEGWVD